MFRHLRICCTLVLVLLFAGASGARAQDETPWFIDLAVGVAPSINGNVNSGAIGTLDGQAAALLPNTYGDVYGTGPDMRVGGGYTLNETSELRGMFTFQTADADLVRLGDIGPSSLYGQYSDYQTVGLDLGYRMYVPLSATTVRPYGEVTMGAAFIDAIDVELAAPQANIVFDNTDFYDQAAAVTWGVNFGALMPILDRMDLNFQMGLRYVSGLPEVDQLVGTGLDDLNADSSRLTFPIVVGVRFRF